MGRWLPDAESALEASFDTGVSRQNGSLVGEGVTRLLQFDASAAELDRLVALDVDCNVLVQRSFIGGVDWEPEPEAGTGWYIDPADATQLHTPSGAVTGLPCSAVKLASAGLCAAALCADSMVMVSTEGGA